MHIRTRTNSRLAAAAILAALAIAPFGLAACGDDAEDNGDGTTAAESTTESTAATDTAAAGGAGGTIDISSPPDGSLAYNQQVASAGAGEVTVNYDNPASLSHDVVIEDDAGTIVGETDLVSEGQASTTVDLQPGTYTFYCSVPGHREGGMEGSLQVK